MAKFESAGIAASWADSIRRDLIPVGFAIPCDPHALRQIADFWEEAGQSGKAGRARATATFWSRNDGSLSPVQMSVLQRMIRGWTLCTQWSLNSGNHVVLTRNHERCEVQFRTFYALLHLRLIEVHTSSRTDPVIGRTDFALTQLGRENVVLSDDLQP